MDFIEIEEGLILRKSDINKVTTSKTKEIMSQKEYWDIVIDTDKRDYTIRKENERERYRLYAKILSNLIGG